MKAAIIKTATNIVENVIELAQDAIWNPPTGYYKIVDNRAFIGATWNGTNFIAPEIIVDNSGLTLTARQFFIMLANSGYVTPQEAVEAAQSGVVPANIAAVFASLPSEQALAAQITWAKMTTIARNEPLIAAVGASLSLTSQEIDQFFIDGQAI
jgi:hypothetical protein